MIKKILFLSLIATLFSVSAFSRSYSFSTNKNYLNTFYTEWYTSGEYIYSGCPIAFPKQCDLKYKGITVPVKMSWEHVVPSARMERYLGCGELNRTDCARVNSSFKLCYNEIHNLYPSILTVNILRSDNRMTEDTYENDKFNNDILLGDDTFTPPYNSWGKVARTYIYMDSIGCISLGKEEREMFERWREVAVSTEELSRNAYIYLKTNTYNEFIYIDLGYM